LGERDVVLETGRQAAGCHRPEWQNPDTEDGLSEFPHVILSQARIHDFLLEKMKLSPGRLRPQGLRENPALCCEEMLHRLRLAEKRMVSIDEYPHRVRDQRFNLDLVVFFDFEARPDGDV
jgi:hypothetical protein